MQGVFHFPRNKRPRTPFGGIRDILAFAPSGSDEKGKRSCSHNVSMDGFTLAYNVTLVKGVFNIDDDDRVSHINCDYETDLVQIELISTDPQSLLEELSTSSYIIGDHSWGCLSNNEDQAEPIYMKIINISRLVPENDSIILTTALASFVELFESTSIQLDIEPNFVSPTSLNADEYVPEQYNHDNHSSRGLQTVYSGQKTFQFSYNYDSDRQVAQTSRVPLNSLVTCEECFYNFNPGFIFNLEVQLSPYFIPYAQSLEMSFYGSGEMSAYMRMKTPQAGVSPEYELTGKKPLTTITLYIFFVPFIIYPSFQMFAQYNVTDASLPMTIFGGFTATATNVKYGYKTLAGGTSNTVVSKANFSFKGTPLSSYYDKSNALSGSFQPRLYLIPRVYLSPYGVVDFAIDVKPYVGPTAPAIAAVTQNSAYITIPLPNVADSSVYYYQVRIKSTSIFSYFSNYVTLSELGYFQTVHTPNCGSADLYSTKKLSSPYNTPIQCSQLCYGDGNCNSFAFSSASNNCYLFNISSSLLISSGCAYNYVYRNQYQIRDSDPFGYTVDNNVAIAQFISFQLASKSFYVSYRALNAKGYSSWSQDSTAALSATAQMTYSGGGNVFLKVTVASNFKVGEVVTVSISLYRFFSTTLLTSQYLTIASLSTLTIPIGNYFTNPYKSFGASNSYELFATVNYPSTLEVYNGYYNTINYYPVVISINSFHSTYAYYEFYANPNQISSVRFRLSYCVSYSYFFGCTSTDSFEASKATSILCSNGFCTWTINYSFTSGTAYSLSFYATDTSGSEMKIQDNSYTPSRRRTEEFVDLNESDAHQVQITDSSNYADTGYLAPAINGEQVENSYLDLSNQTAVVHNEGLDAATHFADISWLQGYTYCAPQTPNGLNYAFFYGVDIAISMQAISIFGFVLFPAWKSRNFALISPTVFSDDLTYASGCLILPPISPSIVIRSPISTDKWGLSTSIHHIAWEFYSISTNASFDICIFDSSFAEVNCTYAYPINKTYALFIDPSLFEVDEQYYAKVAYSTSVYKLSDYFTVVSPESDLSISNVVSIADQPYDDSFTSIGTIFKLGVISIHTLSGTRCQSQYKKYPLNMLCTVTLGINVSSVSIYQFTFSIGLSVEDESKLHVNEFGLLYGINFPEFLFPSTFKSDNSIVSYFLRQLAGKKLTNGASFPSGDRQSLAQVTLSPGGRVCLATLISNLTDYDSCSDIKVAAEKVSKIINLLGMDACLQFNIASVDVVKGGLIFQAILKATVFDATKIDWSEYIGQQTSNPYMQAFITLSGTSKSDAVNSIFQNMLKILHIPSTIEMSKNFGLFASSLLYSKLSSGSKRRAATSSGPLFIDSNGNFLLGSSATGESLVVAPTVAPTVAPSTMSTSIPTLELSSSPTREPSLLPSTTPSKIPTIPSTLIPSSSPVILAPSLSPSYLMTSAPSIPPTNVPSSPPSTIWPSQLPSVISSTVSPTWAPTSAIPSIPSSGPSILPTYADTTPSSSPSLAPSPLPSRSPPTISPSREPSSLWPSLSPSVSPSIAPTL
eukprot:gene23474-30430_t